LIVGQDKNYTFMNIVKNENVFLENMVESTFLALSRPFLGLPTKDTPSIPVRRVSQYSIVPNSVNIGHALPLLWQQVGVHVLSVHEHHR